MVEWTFQAINSYRLLGGVSLKHLRFSSNVITNDMAVYTNASTGRKDKIFPSEFKRSFWSCSMHGKLSFLTSGCLNLRFAWLLSARLRLHVYCINRLQATRKARNYSWASFHSLITLLNKWVRCYEYAFHCVHLATYWRLYILTFIYTCRFRSVSEINYIGVY